MLRIEIKGRWSAQDFGEFYSSMDYLYCLFALIELERRDDQTLRYLYDDFLPSRYRRLIRHRPLWLGQQLIDPKRPRRSFSLLEPEERLTVRSCVYSSPGMSDLAGLGAALGHLKEIVLTLIKLFTDRPERMARVGLLEEERKTAAIENLRGEISVLRELGYSDIQLRQIVAASKPPTLKLLDLAGRGLINDAQEIEGELIE